VADLENDVRCLQGRGSELFFFVLRFWATCHLKCLPRVPFPSRATESSQTPFLAWSKCGRKKAKNRNHLWFQVVSPLYIALPLRCGREFLGVFRSVDQRAKTTPMNIRCSGRRFRKRLIDSRAGRFHAATNADRTHARGFARAASKGTTDVTVLCCFDPHSPKSGS
jgi:hypothetical protein